MHVRNFFATVAAVLALLGGLLPATAPAFAQTGQGSSAYGPVINGFNVEEVSRLAPGTELHFELYGSPGGNVTIRIDGANRNLHLTEVEPGQYTGTYTMGNRDRIRAESGATASLRLGNQVATRVLGESLLQRAGATVARSGSPANAGAPREARYCTSCATVEAVKVIETSGEASAMGTVGGAVVGGLLGSQVGSGSGRTAASVAGAVGGAMAGRQLERHMRRGQRYEVVVRYASNGATRTIQYENDPGFRVGDRVRVNDGVLSLDQ